MNASTAEPSGADPSTAEPSGADPSTAEPSGADPSAAEPCPAEEGLLERGGRERGSVTLWVLYWSLSIMFIAGFGLDLWRGVSTRRSLLEQAEAAAAAGANAVDTDLFRTTGAVVVDPPLADLLAREALAAQGEANLVDSAVVSVDGLTQEVTVELSGEIDFTLIKVFLSGEAPLEIGVAASAAPRIGEP